VNITDGMFKEVDRFEKKNSKMNLDLASNALGGGKDGFSSKNTSKVQEKLKQHQYLNSQQRKGEMGSFKYQS
jgi:hypothetical protein